ncbi:hypothetical protein HK098_007240 [Nowakowskiella sp. JEL0407]|nr:hypothetical protein HK098_007240 [Nowakowskiella sp. JEL0407]
MKDKEQNFRGGCNACTCPEYAFVSNSNKCEDCSCPVTRHKIVDAKKADAGAGGENWKGKIRGAQEGSRIGNSGALRFVVRSFYCWATIVSGMVYAQVTGAVKNSTSRFDRGVADHWYLYAASAFGIGIVFALLGYLGARNYERKALSAVLIGVLTIAFSSYILMFTRATPTWRGNRGGLVDPIRYLEWLGTCPVLIFLIGEITKTKIDVWSTVLHDYLLILLGLVASVLRDPYAEWAGIFSCLSFILVVMNLWNMLTDAIKGKTKSRVDPMALRVTRVIMMGTWWGFPIIWYAVRGGIISYDTGEAMYCVNDIFAKVFFTLVLINSTVEQSQNERVEQISEIATELEERMSNSEALLEKMMPPGVLEQIKSGRATDAEEYECVTVFFSDITNFTVLSSRTSTKDMLGTLNKLWLEYDAIAKRWGVYKVETIGDAYLGVTGCPSRSPDHATKAVNFAIDIIDMVKTFKTSTGENIQIRVGLHSGPVTAGVLGELNPHWCLVGDTVNTASRMESTSKAMQIHISEKTQELAGSGFRFSEPEVMNVKGKGSMTTYWVLGRK